MEKISVPGIREIQESFKPIQGFWISDVRSNPKSTIRQIAIVQGYPTVQAILHNPVFMQPNYSNLFQPKSQVTNTDLADAGDQLKAVEYGAERSTLPLNFFAFRGKPRCV